jgi:hypothetical protein
MNATKKKQQRQRPLPAANATKTKSDSRYERPSARERKRRKILDEAVLKNLTDEMTGFTGLEKEPGDSFEDYRAKEFRHACEVLNTEIDRLKYQQSSFLCGARAPHALVDRDYTLVMLMRAFADYLRFKPTE